MVVKSIIKIKEEIVNIIIFLQLLNCYIGYTIIILCVILITGAIHLALISLAIYISKIFFPKQTSVIIKIWHRLYTICTKILKIISYFVRISMFIWLFINVLSFIVRIDLFSASLYKLTIFVLIHLTLSVILVFVSIVLIKIFDSQFFKVILNTGYITDYLLLFVNALIRSILIFTLILLFLFLLLHLVGRVDYCTKIITCYM